MRFKKLLAVVLCAALGISLCGCKSPKPEPEPLLTEPDTPPILTAHKTVKLGDGGALEITRREIGDTPMGEDGTWTIFVYMSGADLESSRSNGTNDMNEMLAAATGENVKFVVQTGGSSSWKNDFVSTKELGRFLISNGERTKLAGVSLGSMANGSTLRNFLKWGIENYPAENMGLVFWGHGKGTIAGVCRDDLFDESYLSLESINSALSETAALMTDKFEFLGFDNCYMGTAEVADIAATYANYMIASEEIEPADGWDYTVLGNLLGSEPHADRNTIARTLCEGFALSNHRSDNADRITISVIDLSKLDGFLVKFDAYANDLCGAFNNTAALNEFEGYLDGAEHFGNNSKFEGYSNSADIADIIKAGGKYLGKTEELLSVLDDMVIYKKNGKQHTNASGLTVYYPFEARGSAEMKIFAKHCVSPKYLEFINQKQLMTALAPNTSNNRIAELWCGDINNGTHKLDEYLGGEKEPVFNGDKTEKSTLVKFTAEPKYRNGSYTVSLAPECLDKISQVGISVFKSSTENLFDTLGTKPCSGNDPQTGVFSETFDGRWFMLKNRDPLQIKPCVDGRYIAHVKIGRTKASVLFSSDENKRLCAVDGVWYNNESNEATFSKLPVGETIMAYYDVCTKEGEKVQSEKGEKYVVGNEPNIIYDALGDGDYYYMVVVEDIRGNRYETEPVKFALKGGKLDFDLQPEPKSE